MKRTIKRKPKSNESYNAILCADLHIREDTPICRTDNYLNAQFTKMSFIKHLCEEHHCPLLCAGDLMDNWKPSPWLLSRCIELLPSPIICVPGQHDLQNHSLDSFARTGLNTLQQAGKVFTLHSGHHDIFEEERAKITGYAYGEEAARNKTIDFAKDKQILLWHKLVTAGEQPWPGAQASKATHLLARADLGYDLIVTGDNHQQFVIEYKNRVLVNPGSMMRMSSDQANFEPAVFGWRAKDNSVERIPLPIEKGVVQKVERSNKEEKEKRFNAYIKQMKKHFELGLSFTKNMEDYLSEADENEETEQIIWEAMT